jgi:hypothetical protein
LALISKCLKPCEKFKRRADSVNGPCIVCQQPLGEFLLPIRKGESGEDEVRCPEEKK